MNANDIAPNLYEEWGLDRRDGERELLVLLESKDLSLEQQGQDMEDPRRAQLRIAASVLGSAAKRAEYDKACGAGLRPTWGEALPHTPYRIQRASQQNPIRWRRCEAAHVAGPPCLDLAALATNPWTPVRLRVPARHRGGLVPILHKDSVRCHWRS